MSVVAPDLRAVLPAIFSFASLRRCSAAYLILVFRLLKPLCSPNCRGPRNCPSWARKEVEQLFCIGGQDLGGVSGSRWRMEWWIVIWNR